MPTGIYPRKPTPPINRFEPKVCKTEDCWIWNGAMTREGYGNFWINGRLDKAHRASYIIYCGEIADGLEIDHLCRNRRCVNPEHLEAVSHSVNLRRGDRKTKQTHCKRGHPFSEENTRVYINRFGYHIRICRECEIYTRRIRRAA